MRPRLQLLAAGAMCISTLTVPAPTSAWELAGVKEITLHTRDGQAIPIGAINFQPKGDRIGFSLHLEHARFKDFFLSMKEFKCIEGRDEIQCHVPYPYANPATVTPTDMVWLEHSLLFLYKQPTDFGARLWNGVYYRMSVTEEGIVGTPQAVDLNLISAPPANASVPPFGPEDRNEMPAQSRWISKLTIR